MIKNYLSLVKFSHTIFALPFALVGFFYGMLSTDFTVRWYLIFIVIACMITARNAAMGFNRYLDRDIDVINVRTQNREIPGGKIKPANALRFVIINCALFILFTTFINITCFILSPVALIVILGYSYTKRFTWLCHFVLGIGLALAPMGAYLAVTGHFTYEIVILSFAVFFWVSGFDIIYALQDEEFDKKQNLKSIPVLMGLGNSLYLSLAVHSVAIVLISIFVYNLNSEFNNFDFILVSGAVLFNIIVIYQHTLVNPRDLSRIDSNFFTTNGIASLLFGLSFIIDIYW